MQGDFLVKIRSTYNQFTKAEKKVADFILQNPKEVLFMSITDLAEACDVGDTSVFRFCKTMELKGYQEFKMMLSLSINSDGSNTTDSNQYNVNINLEDSFPELAQKVLNTNVNALMETYSLLDNVVFSKALDVMVKSSRICFFGVGASLLTAMKAMNKFSHIEPKVYCVQDAHIQAMVAATMHKGEAAVLFSYSGATKDTINIASIAKKRGAKIICVTRFVKSPMTAYADYVLLCGANEGPLQGGSTSAELSQMFLVDLMYTEYYRRNFEKCSKNNEATSAAVLDKLY